MTAQLGGSAPRRRVRPLCFRSALDFVLHLTQNCPSPTLRFQLRTKREWSITYDRRTCPSCGSRHKPHGREYICSCGFEGHRDIVGAANIRQKYLGQDDTRQPSVSPLQVAGEGPKRSVMASPTGVRYRPHMRCKPQRCNPASSRKTSTEPTGSQRQECRPVG